MSSRVWVALTLLLLLATACQPVPHPFAPDHKALLAGQYLQVTPRAGLMLQPVAGLPGDGGTTLAGLLAAELRQRDVTASTAGGHSRSHRLTGSLLPEAGLLRWQITTPDGDVLRRIDQPVEAGDFADTAALQRLARQAGELIDLTLADAEAGSGRRLALANVRVGTIDGAPGNGRQALFLAMRRALRDAGVTVPDQDLTEPLLLLGSVNVVPAGAQTDDVEVVWHLLAPDGRELGRVSQRNNVPTGSLNGPWGAIAREIADAATGGIIELLREAGGQKG